MIAYMFPGQGSQARGMGSELLGDFPKIVALADSVLGYSVAEVCLRDPHGQLGDTRFTQPLVYLVNALHLLRRRENGDPDPAVVLGHSLGEFNALHAAGCFSLEDGLRLVKRRAELFADASEGGMGAVLGAGEYEVRSFLQSHGFTQIDIAGLNAPTQVVIAGPRDELKRAGDAFTQNDKAFMPLRTSGAFHSRLMAGAARGFEDELRAFEFKPPRIPVLANVSARPHELETLRRALVDQIVSPVRWCESVQLALANGVEEFVEVGHGNVLATMVKHVRRETSPASLVSLRGLLDKGARADGDPVDVIAQHAGQGVDPFERVRAWNDAHAPGVSVFSRSMPGKELRTRTKAIVLFGHRPAVYVEGCDGYFALSDLSVRDGSIAG